jgi:hypothetical protein
MQTIATLRHAQGGQTRICYDPGNLEALVHRGDVDAYIVATEDGFSPLGANLRFLSEDLGVPEDEIKRLADRNRFENPEVSLVAIRSRKRDSQLRGVILAASETSLCYSRFAVPRYGKPYRDFYYNVSYEAIAHTVKTWGARKLAISHLSGCGCFHEDIATCHAEALAHYCDAHSPSADSLLCFFGCCISRTDLRGTERLYAEGQTGRHRPVSVQRLQYDGHVQIDIAWKRMPAPRLRPCPNTLPPALERYVSRLGNEWAQNKSWPRIRSDVARHWNDLLHRWFKDKSLPVFARKANGNRGSEVRTADGRIIVPTDNSPAQWVYALAASKYCPSLAEISLMLDSDEIPVAFAMGPREREAARLTCTLGKFGVNAHGWKLAHVKDIGLNRVDLQNIAGSVLEEHFLSFLSPCNMFLVPMQWAGLAEVKAFAQHFRCERE